MFFKTTSTGVAGFPAVAEALLLLMSSKAVSVLSDNRIIEACDDW
jgi:hypothetical protein